MAESWAVLFDLDGTLVDTAPDLAAAANRMREARNLPLLPLANLRPVASQGASGLLRAAFGLQPEDRAFAAMRDEFLKNYQEHICEQTTLFPGMTHVLSLLEERGVAWGIVTNKPGFLTIPLIAALKLTVTPGAIVSGDTTARAKPDPLPVMHALQQLGATGKQSIMIGDDPRDILAGRAAGTQCWAAGWGYIEAGDDPEGWGADQVIRNSRSLELALLHFHTTQ
ncbi:HAD family hydrolase [Acidithiobacillus sp.]|jgi:phosphoglycolate phosphatase|uniref:HAD family hydrolase n=1 Tax=Acidithiobacillus sp. TaxID=1872118 RepID=UPI0025C1E047|nr:HAD-IA family hydrolase [Acidithiobacillus sp.]MCK9188461.1 HAD-IA family hydrolase [Acidithiobacillus sp.]MCK9358882.1 HAD-IA family hydrolase [Acidithiobacillus sp.]